MTRVGLVQVNNSFSGQNYLPYSLGILQAYAAKHLRRPQDYEFLLPIYKRLPVEEAVDRLRGADLVFFSTYVWNARISLEIARSLKRRDPKAVVVFGGPHVPDRAQDFLRRHPFVDYACHSEGEQAFLSMLENLPRSRPEAVPSVSYVDAAGALRSNPRAERLRDLSAVPSPYLTGVFDPLMRAHPEEQWLMMWETNRGCPFSCAFCDWGSATQSKVFQFDMDRLLKELDWCARHKIEFIFCADANFGILPRDLDIARYAAGLKTRTGYPQALSVQNTKNATERAYQVQKTLADAGLNKGVTIAFQSVDPATLRNIRRDNISSESFRELQRRFTRDGIVTYSDMILGLPGETYDSFAGGVSSTIENGQHNRIQFGNLSILPNAEMGDPEYQRKHGMKAAEIREVIFHGLIDASADEVAETSQVVVATASMPPEDWVRTRAFCWTASLLHFDKIFQIPLIVAHGAAGASYRELFEVFTQGDLSPFPILGEIRAFFLDKARKIQAGGEEYVPAPEFLNLWWPADEYVFIRLVKEGNLGRFYEQAEAAVLNALEGGGKGMDPALLHEAIALNSSLIKVPFQTQDLDLSFSYNVWDYYQGALKGKGTPLERRANTLRVDRTTLRWTQWESWLKEVVWYGNKKGAYLYGQSPLLPQLQGHF